MFDSYIKPVDYGFNIDTIIPVSANEIEVICNWVNTQDFAEDIMQNIYNKISADITEYPDDFVVYAVLYSMLENKTIKLYNTSTNFILQ